MDSKEMGELLSRIDERTENMAKRQVEEIDERKKLSIRVESLETWRNVLTGAYGAMVGFVGAIGVYVKAKH